MTLNNPPIPTVHPLETPREGMALADFLRRQDEQPFELIEGEIIPMSPSVFGSGETLSLLLAALFAYSASTGHVRVYADTTFVLPNTPETNWITESRIPDAMVYAVDRLEAYRTQMADSRLKPLMLIPDLVVEVVSPTDKASKVLRKVALYLENGVPLVWIVNPMQQIITIYTGDRAPVTLNQVDSLTGSTLLPSFSLSLKTLFEE